MVINQKFQSIQKVIKLEVSQDVTPDIIRLDIRFPDGGVNICDQLKNNTSSIQVILMWAHTNNSILAQNYPDNFIPKPFDIDFLTQSIEHLLK